MAPDESTPRSDGPASRADGPASRADGPAPRADGSAARRRAAVEPARDTLLTPIVLMTPAELWQATIAERHALAAQLEGLDPDAWSTPTQCPGWDVEDQLAHLTAAALTTRGAWMRSMALARLRPEVHNARRIAQHRGVDGPDTLRKFQAAIEARIAPTDDVAPYLGEVVVHGEDIREALGLESRHEIWALTAVADFYWARDFAVPSRTLSRGLHLVAEDGPFEAGAGPLIEGPTLAFVMAMAGRRSHLDPLRGPGAAQLRMRIERGI